MSLFAYILRHTFWRPRDVLLHYAKIIAVADNLHRHEHVISVETIRRIVKEVNFEIISSEFIQEFRSIVANIEDVIQAFSRCKQFLPYPDLIDIIGGQAFEFVIGKPGIDEVDAKIDFLYDIGFLGIYVSDDLKEQLGVTHKHAYYFNEGDQIKRTGVKGRYDDSVFIVHPIFVEYLRLSTAQGELVLYFDWNYLRENEALRHARAS